MPHLWAVHVIGPDDIVAAPSFEYAERAAKAVTETFKGSDPEIRAIAIEWPLSTDQHAKEVNEFNEYFGDLGVQHVGGAHK